MSAQLLDGKTIVITGASSGIGRATALLAGRSGANVVFIARSTEKLQDLAKNNPDQSLAITADVRSLEQMRGAIQQAVARFGQVDALFANAGVYISGDVSSGDPGAWSELIDINVKGVMNSVAAILPELMQRGRGDIIVCSSISGHQAIHWEPVYSASKHAIQSFVHGLRRQLLTSGIRVGAVAPGMVLNELWGLSDQAEIDRRAAAGEGLISEDVAEAVYFMLTRPRNVTIRDLVMLPRCQDL
jgi:ribitol 2-dehydrogenase